MDKNEEAIIKKLREAGVTDDFLEKPGILERCIERYRKNDSISFNGYRLQIGTKEEFGLIREPNPLVKSFQKESAMFCRPLKFRDGEDSRWEGYYTEQLDEYGIPQSGKLVKVSFNGLDAGDNFEITAIRANGLIITSKPCYGGKEEAIYLDLGCIDIFNDNMGSSINGIGIYYIDRNGNIVYNDETISAQEILERFDSNAERVIRKYPKTEGYYKRQRSNVIEAIKRVYLENPSKCPIIIEGCEEIQFTDQDYMDAIHRLTKVNDDLTEKNNKLKKKNHDLSSKLRVALDFCEDVKKSRFGRFFFGKGLKRLKSGDITKTSRLKDDEEK